MKQNKNKIWIIPITAIIILFITAGVKAQGCAISPSINHPLMPDTDCDGIIDEQDNCPFITNPLQRDYDGNGLGNLCDLYIESIRTNPADFVYNNRAFNTIVTLHNNRPHNIRNLKIRVIAPELGIESVQYIDNLEVCESETLEFFLRAPACVPMHDYELVVEASFTNPHGLPESMAGVTSIRVIPDKHCMSVINNGQTLGNTFIDVMEIQDVYKGSEAVFPIRISNQEANGKEYILSVTGHEEWGSARLEPGKLIIVPSESDRKVDLYVSAGRDVRPGERVFVVSIQSGEEIQRFLLIANVKENPARNNAFLWLFSLRVLLIALIAVLLAAGIVIGIRRYMASIKSQAADQDMRYY